MCGERWKERDFLFVFRGSPFDSALKMDALPKRVILAKGHVQEFFLFLALFCHHIQSLSTLLLLCISSRLNGTVPSLFGFFPTTQYRYQANTIYFLSAYRLVSAEARYQIHVSLKAPKSTFTLHLEAPKYGRLQPQAGRFGACCPWPGPPYSHAAPWIFWSDICKLDTQAAWHG